MVGDRVNRYARDVETLFVAGAIGDLGDAQLLERFLEHDRDHRAAEMAFAALVDRHGPMVLRVCVGVLGDLHDAQDVSQATFLVLARRAGSVRRRESVASWLHGVALRLAAKVKRGAARRRSHERRGGEIMAARRAEQGKPSPESSQALHQELARLPERFREPIVLCHLEGLTQAQAARRLGWPIGTVQSRLARGCDRLRDRLTRRGVAPSAGAFVTGASADASVTAAWVESTARAAVQIAAGRSIAGSVPASVMSLCESGSRSLMMSRLFMSGGVLAMIGAIVAGSVALGRSGQDRADPVSARADARSRPPGGREGRPPAEASNDLKDPSIVGRWQVLYIAGTVAGKRQAFVEPGLIVPIAGENLNLPALTGNDRDPINYLGEMEYSSDNQDGVRVIDIRNQAGLGGAPARMRGLCRVAGDSVFLCYDPKMGTLPASFAAGKETETVLILRRERPASPTTAPIPPGGFPPTATVPQR